MNKAVNRLEQDMTESKINELVSRHYETHSLLQGQLSSEIDTMKEAQRREYREWIMEMLEENQANSSLPVPRLIVQFLFELAFQVLLCCSSPLNPAHSKSLESRECNLNRQQINVPILEESFTIHLGSQLKQMHNIRILSASVMDLCAIEDNEQMYVFLPY